MLKNTNKMPSLYKTPLAIQWHEGMLMKPQHLQQAHLREEKLRSIYNAYSLYYPWGIVDLDLDVSSLANGKIAINAVEAIMPDGLYLDYNRSSWPELVCDINDVTNSNILIYLAVPKADIEYGFANQNSPSPRYISISAQSIKDQNTGSEDFTIPSLMPNLKLLKEEEVNDLVVSIPIIKISKALGNWEVKQFSPPLLQLDSSNHLWKICTDLLSIIRDKVQNLRKRSLRSGDKGFLGTGLMRAASLLSYCFLELEALLNSQKATPFDVYLRMCSLASFASTIGEGTGLPLFNAYDHNNIDKSFEQVIVFVEKILKSLKDSYTALNFNKNDIEFTFVLAPDLIKEKEILIGLRSQALQDMPKLQQWFKGAVVSGRNFITVALEHRTLGLKRKEIETKDQIDLVAPRDILLAKVSLSEDYINIGDELVIYNPGIDQKGIPLEILIYIPYEQDRGK